MVQYTNIFVASAIAATVPALAAPFAYLASREIEDVDVREPMFKAAIDLAAHGPARRVITAPLKKTANDAIDHHNHPLRSGPGPAQAAMNKILQEQKSHGGSKGKRNLEDYEDLNTRGNGQSKSKRSLGDFEDLDTREPMFKAALDLAAHGPARRVITAPLRKTAKEAIYHYNHPLRSGPGPAQAAMNKILQEQKSHGESKGKRSLEDFEDLDAREPMFKAITDLATHAPARRVITEPLKKTAHDAIDQHNHPLRAGPGPAQAAMNKILHEQKSNGGSKGKRSLEDLEDLDAREPMFKAITDIATHAPARRVITEPLKKTAHDAIDQHNHPSHSGPGPAQAAMNRIHQEQKAKDFAHSFDAQRAAAHAASRGKRELELEDLLERDFFDLD